MRSNNNDITTSNGMRDISVLPGKEEDRKIRIRDLIDRIATRVSIIVFL